MTTAITATGRKVGAWMVGVFLMAGIGLLVAHVAIGIKASNTIASQSVSYQGKDIVTVADAHAYAHAVLDTQLAASTTASSTTDSLLNQRAAFMQADSLAKFSQFAVTAYRACFVAGAVLMAALAFGIARRDNKAQLSARTAV